MVRFGLIIQTIPHLTYLAKGCMRPDEAFSAYLWGRMRPFGAFQCIHMWSYGATLAHNNICLSNAVYDEVESEGMIQ